eukprot:5298547-Pyramimonas_sp.AAC.1
MRSTPQICSYILDILVRTVSLPACRSPSTPRCRCGRAAPPCTSRSARSPAARTCPHSRISPPLRPRRPPGRSAPPRGTGGPVKGT